MKKIHLAAAIGLVAAVAGAASDPSALLKARAAFADTLLTAIGAPDPARTALAGVSGIHLYQSVAVPGTGLTIVTGAIYADVRELAAGKAALTWCDANRQDAATRIYQAIELGRQERGAATPTFTVASDIPPAQAEAFGVSPDRLVELARRACQFDPA